MTKYILICLTFNLMIFHDTSLANNIYRWVDQDGKIHFGESPNHEFESAEFNKQAIQIIAMKKTKPLKAAMRSRKPKTRRKDNESGSQCKKVKQAISVIENKLKQRLEASKFDSYNNQLNDLRWQKIKRC